MSSELSLEYCSLLKSDFSSSLSASVSLGFALCQSYRSLSVFKSMSVPAELSTKDVWLNREAAIKRTGNLNELVT
jgi:hypothetical protein